MGLISGLTCPSPSLMLCRPHSPSPGEQVGLTEASPTQGMADPIQHPDPVMETSGLTNLWVKKSLPFISCKHCRGQRLRLGQSPARQRSSASSSTASMQQSKCSRGAAKMPRAPGAAADVLIPELLRGKSQPVRKEQTWQEESPCYRNTNVPGP